MVTPNSRHSGNYDVKHQLGIKVPLQPNELISSWLVRTALIHSCDPLVITGEVWGTWRVWTIDADRIYADALLQPISNTSSIPVESFKETSLYPIAKAIIGDTPPQKIVWPWILALGARNTKRNGGLQYCPLCLADDAKPHFKRQWRFAWHTACDKHQCLLLDRCHVCNSPIEPHRLIAEDQQITTCATCKTDLSTATLKELCLESLAFQRLADKIIQTGYGEFQQQIVSIPDWFKLSDFFESMLRRANRGGTVILQDFLSQITTLLPNNFPIRTGAGIELLHTNERQTIFGSLHQIMTFNKEDFERIALKSNITRQSFCSKDEVLPVILTPLYEKLPDNPKLRSRKIKRSPHQPRPRHEVLRMMARLERKLEMAQR